MIASDTSAWIARIPSTPSSGLHVPELQQRRERVEVGEREAPSVEPMSAVTSIDARNGLRWVGCTSPSQRGRTPSRPIEKK